MSNFKDLIELAKTEGGKFFVMDESGEAKLVILSIADYQKLLLQKSHKQTVDVEKVNEEIVKAQASSQHNLPLSVKISSPDWRSLKPRSSVSDLREEVIDPSFDFEGPRQSF